ISTDRIDDLTKLEDEWRAQGRGRRTGIGDWLCADRSQPGRYFSINLFPSHQAATANAALPETDALASQAMQLGTAVFYHCDVVQDLWANELAAQSDCLVEMFATATVPDGLFTDDVHVELNVPHAQEMFEGLDTVRSRFPHMVDPGRVEQTQFTRTIGG